MDLSHWKNSSALVALAKKVGNTAEAKWAAGQYASLLAAVSYGLADFTGGKFAPAPLAPSEPESAKASHGDQNLADMAQQLEAALRRTPMPESRPPVTDPLVASAKPAPAREFRSRIEPKFEPARENKSETKAESKTENKTETKSELKLETAVEPKVELAPSKAPFDNLEEEMANLLGRPPGKT